MKTIKGEHRAISREYERVYKHAEKVVIAEARRIMKKHPHLVEFIMAMGTFYFVDKNNEIVDTTVSEMNASYNYVTKDSFAYFKKLNDFIGEWNEYLKLTGAGIRFKVSGKIVTDW